MPPQKSKPIDAVWAEWDKHIKAANAGNYNKAEGWMTVEDFVEKANCKRQAASTYLLKAYHNEEMDREWVVLNGKRRLMYRPKVNP